jgi:hypothetical protein
MKEIQTKKQYFFFFYAEFKDGQNDILSVILCLTKFLAKL